MNNIFYITGVVVVLLAVFGYFRLGRAGLPRAVSASYPSTH